MPVKAWEGFLVVLQWHNLLFLLFGVVGGIIVGALPGLTATLGVALLIPLTFGMDPSTGLIMLGGIYCGAFYGGSISAILIRTPGTPAAAATVFDGYQMTLKGEAGKALGGAVVSSFTGGMISAAILLLLAPPLAEFSLKFGPPEYFWLAVFGLTIIASLSGHSLVKGLISGGIGLILSTIGMHPLSGFLRFTFGQTALYDGIPIIIALIGLFSFSQVLVLAETRGEAPQVTEELVKSVAPTRRELREISPTLLRSSIIGTIVGMIPGAGGDIASFMGYNEAKRFSKHPERFGKGTLEGVVASEAANNGVTGGSLIPLLTLGIPGNSVTAVFLGGILIHGMRPGAELFTEHARVTYSLIMSLFLANTMFLVIGLLGARYFIRVTKVPRGMLAPIILALSVVGSYAIRNSVADVWLMLGVGLLGYFMRKLEFPLAPICLAIILGPLAESSLARALVMARAGEIPILLMFLTRPLTLVLIALTLLSLLPPLIRHWKGAEMAAEVIE